MELYILSLNRHFKRIVPCFHLMYIFVEISEIVYCITCIFRSASLLRKNQQLPKNQQVIIISMNKKEHVKLSHESCRDTSGAESASPVLAGFMLLNL